MALSMPLPYLNQDLCFHISDSQLVKDAQAGDLESFNGIVLKYQDMLFRIALHILADRGNASDAVQNGLISAYQHIRSFNGGSLKSWLIRIVVNECNDQLRCTRNRMTFSLDTLIPNNWESNDDLCFEFADSGMPIESYMEAFDLDRVIQESLKALPYYYRSIVVLADIEELPYIEISSILKIPMGTVKSRLARARLQLRNSLHKHSSLLPEKYATGKRPKGLA